MYICFIPHSGLGVPQQRIKQQPHTDMLIHGLTGMDTAINAGAIAIVSSLLILTAKFECGR